MFTLGRKRSRKTSYKRRGLKRRSFKRSSFKRRPRVYRRRSYKRRVPRVHLRVTRGYRPVGALITRQKGSFKIKTHYDSQVLSLSQTTGNPCIVSYQFVQNSLIGSANYAYLPSTFSSRYKPPPGIVTTVYNNFHNTLVVASRLTCVITRTDGFGADTIRAMLTPISNYTWTQSMTGGGGFATTTALWTGSTVTDQVYNQSIQPGTHIKSIGNAMSPGPNTPAVVKISSTVHQSKMNTKPNWMADASYTEQQSSSLPQDHRNIWVLTIYNEGPGASGTLNFQIRVYHTWWIKAWEPNPTSTIQAALESKGESKEESKEEKDDMRDVVEIDETEMENLYIRSPPVSLRSPSPARSVIGLPPRPPSKR